MVEIFAHFNKRVKHLQMDISTISFHEIYHSSNLMGCAKRHPFFTSVPGNQKYFALAFKF